MTSGLRTFIKKRDDYKCCSCRNGIENEPNLLLEIDHILPISKGGLTNEENLQTLCWRCNRSKGSKIIV
jgi:5-methylcytosine-specific restriction endonuclease McrA